MEHLTNAIERATKSSFEDRLVTLDQRADRELESGHLSLELPGAMAKVGLLEEVDLDPNPMTRDAFEAMLQQRLAA